MKRVQVAADSSVAHFAALVGSGAVVGRAPGAIPCGGVPCLELGFEESVAGPDAATQVSERERS